MKLTVRKKNSTVIFDIDGNISFEDTAELESFIFKNIPSGYSCVVINLEKASYLTSSALGSFVRIRQTIKDKGISMSMMNASKDVDNLFKITGINRYFDYITSEDNLP